MTFEFEYWLVFEFLPHIEIELAEPLIFLFIRLRENACSSTDHREDPRTPDGFARMKYE